MSSDSFGCAVRSSETGFAVLNGVDEADGLNGLNGLPGYNGDMRYDFVEIGTADFDTLIQKASVDSVGLSVEPIRYYLERLPSPKGVRKVLAAITQVSGDVDIHWIPPEKIRRLRLWWWMRGCGSLGPHPAVYPRLKNKGIVYEDVVVIERVKGMTLQELFVENKVESIGILKVDAEGCDGYIIEAFADLCAAAGYLLADRVEFENNGLVPVAEVSHVIEHLCGLGYHLVRRDRQGVVLTRLSGKKAASLEAIGQCE